MVRNETKLMESAVVLAEELHFSHAARKIGISQPMLTKNIQDLEMILGGCLFIRDKKNVVLSDAGRAYVEHARLSLLYSERAMQAARSAMQGADVPLYVGRSPYTDPFLISTLLSIHLPLFPRLKIELTSQYSIDLVHEVLAGSLDLAFVTHPPDSRLLTTIQIAESPFYIAMAKRDNLASQASVTLEALADRRWVIFERRLHPTLYDLVLHTAEQRNIRPSSIQHITGHEESFPFVADGKAVAFLFKAGALLIARNGVTVRPLMETALLLKTVLASRGDNESKVASELVRAFIRKISDVGKHLQLSLPISG